MSHSKVTCAVILTIAIMQAVFAASANEVIDVIRGSKTTQAFTQEEVSEDDLKTILEVGLSTASAINQQPWHFVVLSDTELMNKLGEIPAGMPAGIPSDRKPEGDFGDNPPPAMPGAPTDGASAKASLGDSPVAIILYANRKSISPNVDFDCGLACQNMVIAANSLDYGTKIISSPTNALNGDDHDSICDTLGIDRDLYAVAVLLIGRGDVSVDGYSGATTRFSIDEKVTFVE
ncbi:MAG: nitroreductase family protein [Christensenellales bacterium]